MLNWLKDIPKPIWVFTALWFLLGLVQAALMDLHPDEAYYWQMSRFMDWGYFHQPPMIAVFIKIGYGLFQNELGVRLITVLTSTLGIPILYSLSRTTDWKAFLFIFLGLILTHAGVFMAVPDSPLIFFTLVFLLLLKAYLKKDSLLTALGLGIIAAALMYSKYHSIVLFASALLAVPKLLLRKSFWLTVLIGVVLFLPHVFWQFDHDLVSFKFHWVVREKKSWNILILLDYLLGQAILLGPVGVILLILTWSSKTLSPFDQVLKAVVVGFFSFFFLLALRGKVEPNWTASAFLPLIILGSRAIDKRPEMWKSLKPSAIVMIVLLFTARGYVASPIAGKGIKLNFPLRGWEKWASNIQTKADGLPVFFANSYQLVSQYSFYSGEQGYHISPLNYNGNQFDIWNFDDEQSGREFALFLGSGPDTSMAVSVDGFKTMYCFRLKNYNSFRNLRLEFSDNQFEALPESLLELNGNLINRTSNTIDLDSLLVARPLKIFYYLDGVQTPAEEISCTGCNGELNPGESKPVSFELEIPPKSGNYFVRFGLDFALGMPEQNSDFIQLKVKEE